MNGPTPTPDPLERLRGLGAVLAPRRDPGLAESLGVLRATVDPGYARELEREHAHVNRAAPTRLPGDLRGGLAMEEKPRCQWCRRPTANPYADCRACGHAQDPLLNISTGGRYTVR